MSSSHTAPLAQPHVPFVVERYAVYDAFESGGMAKVHFARLLGAQGFRRTVAAKRLLPHLLADQAFAELLSQEARLSARVRHPNVVATLDVVQTASELLLVMEYVHGESLARLARAASQRGEAIPLTIAVAIVVDALHGLHAAHEAKDERGQPLQLVHRDVSPQNVLVGTDGITRIADFGIARAAGRSPVTRDGVLKGKLGYMAPEQIGAGPITRAADIFAAATVLWELLTGEQLFGGHTHAEVAFKVAAAPIAPPSARNAAVSPELDAIVARALARDPLARYATAHEMALALEASTASARPSELAAFVERVAAESLARRAALLRSIERQDGEVGQLRARDERTPEASKTGGSSAERSFIMQRAEPARAADVTLNRGSSPKGGALTPAMPVPSQSTAATRSAYPRLGFALALLAIALLGTSAARELRRDQPAPAAARAPVAAAPDVPVSAAAPTPAPAQRATASDTARDAAVAAPTPASSLEPSSPRRRRPQRSAAGCDPPFSIDRTGKVLFKIECMEQGERR